MLDTISLRDRDSVIHKDHKGNLYSIGDLETTHLINIARRRVNEFALAIGIDPVPIKNPMNVETNFKPNKTGMLFLLSFISEIDSRLVQETVSNGYITVFSRVKEKTQQILNKTDEFGMFTIDTSVRLNL
jgi:hypothetical protein